eukprot:g37954.t1
MMADSCVSAFSVYRSLEAENGYCTQVSLCTRAAGDGFGQPSVGMEEAKFSVQAWFRCGPETVKMSTRRLEPPGHRWPRPVMSWPCDG